MISNMKTLIALSVSILFSIQSLFAGAPGLEIKEALVHEVKETPLGYALVVSGKARVGSIEGIVAEKAIVTHPFGSPINFVEDVKAYKKRLKSLVGKKITLQVWGDIVTMTGGKITAIHGGVVPTLSPTKEENPKFHIQYIMDKAKANKQE